MPDHLRDSLVSKWVNEDSILILTICQMMNIIVFLSIYKTEVLSQVNNVKDYINIKPHVKITMGKKIMSILDTSIGGRGIEFN